MTEESDRISDVVENALDSVLDKRLRIDEKTHYEQHQYIAQMIKKESKQNARIEKIKDHVIGWSVVVVLSGVVSGIGFAIRQYIKHVGE